MTSPAQIELATFFGFFLPLSLSLTPSFITLSHILPLGESLRFHYATSARRDECSDTTGPTTTTTLELWEMESEVALGNEQHFWDEIQEIVSAPCSSEDLIDNTLRSYLSLATQYKGEYLRSDLEVSRCSYKLLSSNLFANHADYIRKQMIFGLLQEDDSDTLSLIASFLLFDGRRNEIVLRVMNEEGVFPRLLELLQAQNKKKESDGDEAGLHRLLMDLMYELSRIQRIRIEDLVLVDDDFIKSLFEIIEHLSYDVNDPYHYPVIRVLLVLNEQFMISAHNPVDERASSNPLTNKVIKVLSMHGNLYKTFGENIILLINREAETSLQLLTLKLLYLIFTTPRTYEYFYTNDLHVLVDILIRNLLDLPEEASALRHTYLRVLYPLLAHTQLKAPPHYKRDELRRMLNAMVRGRLSDSDADTEKIILHFDEVDETTRRLVLRCATVDWIQEKQSVETTPTEPALPDIDTSTTTTSPLETSQTISSASTGESSPDTASPTRFDDDDDGGHHHSSKLDAHRKLSQTQRLGMHLERASSSSLSVQEVATQHEKPGVITPSRTDTLIQHPSTDGQHQTISPTKSKSKVKPLPPKTRRWRGRRATYTDDEAPDKMTIMVSEASPTPTSSIASPITVTPTSTPDSAQAVDRRNSTTTSGLVPPPVPAHIRRSVSNPPPALPPPRRSTHPIHPHHISSHCTPLSSPSRPQHPPTPTIKQSQPPEPPRTRRGGRGRHAQPDPSHNVQPGPEQPNDDNSNNPSEKYDGPTVSVEEAVQNVSLH
ncbi:hypothetical protein FE257_008796 [Aspergillus nanangensis]|uniref:SPIN90/Ldb17 leucine-rich domain-containing protein n=1 Tax=Aspergillus nanangensis TaxID=2582783 RepID=A0AAD4CMA0_ASPNN|nr:hypothetical protein FE257_008796 [Aspergillus nanangensis]